MHQGPFKISTEWRPLALWISHSFIYCPIVYLDKQKGTATPFAEEVLNTPNYLGRGNNGLHTAHFVCLLESSKHTRLHIPAPACRLPWNTVPSFTWLCNLFLVHHERKKSIRCSRCCKCIAPCYFHWLHSHCPERNQGFSIQLSFLCLDNWISVPKGFRNPSYTDRMCQIYNFRSKQIEGQGSVHPSIHCFWASSSLL